MARTPTGEVRKHSDGAFSTAIRTFEKRETFPLPHATTDGEAKERSALLADVALRFRRTPDVNRRQASETLKLIAAASPRSLRNAVAVAEEIIGCGRILKTPDAPTFGKVAGQWTSGELQRLHPDHVAGTPKRYGAQRPPWQAGRSRFPVPHR